MTNGNLCPNLFPRLFISLLFLTLFSFLPLHAQEKKSDTTGIAHTFYIISNTGSGAHKNTSAILKSIVAASKHDSTATLLLPGNITPENGYLHKDSKREEIENFLQKELLVPLSDFNGNIIYTPGENEWNKSAPQSLDDLESFLQDRSNGQFLPDDGCPVEDIEINDNVALITIDSQWYLEDWDQNSEFNVECDIRTKERFFIEIKDALKDNFGKVKILVMHHPVMSSSTPGFFSRVFPFSRQNFENPVYTELRKTIETLASQFDDVIFVSGNHANLQFLTNERNPQVISATAGETASAKALKDEHFASEEPGFAKLRVFKNGNSDLHFFKVNRESTASIFHTIIPGEQHTRIDLEGKEWKDLGDTYAASIYTSEETEKSGIFRFLWGKHYRDVYDQKIEVPVLLLDTIYGGLKPIKEGGGQQSRSIRFINEDDHEFTLRALRKSPGNYIQADLLPTSYIGDRINNTFPERLVLDYFTTSHPYAKFALDNFSEALDLPHIKPEIYYVPRQPGLGIHNDEYGDELYELQAHAGSENKSFAQFENPQEIISTFDLLEELREDPQAEVVQEEYIKARLFDMLIGDWDRHQDNWRWAEYEEDGKKKYVPIPRDRDQSFSRYDGPLIRLLKFAEPRLRKMQTFDEDIDDVAWFNWSGYSLDLQFLSGSSWEQWQEQAAFIQKTITDEVIASAFAELPQEAQDQSIEEIKQKLKGRRENLQKIAADYFKHLQQFTILTGTDEDETFTFERKANGKTEIIKAVDGKEIARYHYDSKTTNEVWIYGMAGDDTFTVTGPGDDHVLLRILGGPGTDTYNFENKRDVKLYDFKSSENEILQPAARKLLVDSYEINNFYYKKFKYSTFKVLPYVNFETDAGFTLGAKTVWTKYGLVNNPFSAQHELLANYYFDTNGFSIRYQGEFAHLFYNWNFGLTARYTSPNYTLNYFGSGSEAPYFPDAVDKKYNRLKIQKWNFSPALIWRNEGGSGFDFRVLIESFKVEYETDNFLAEVFPPENDIFDTQLYAGAESSYRFYSKNRKAFPSLGSDLGVTAGYKKSIDGAGNEFGYVEPYISLNYPLIPSGYAVFATKIGGEAIFGDNYEIYHAATLGGNRSLRGYRNHRFNGKQAFYHSTDLRTALGLWENNFLPFVYGVTAGFDYGRVWLPEENSDQWHSNYGGSVWISAGLALTGNIGLYHGGDGNRISVMLNFKY
ncbi:metallophosphatase [Salinimicrobium oceani]|uniref:Metallophosphatase n=1 Tax=Salinimicrobium oceani TaxID=2722702 RepID=A0ABX1CW26_9FLAO|nr:metallophosphatase [Salinimicrobium oceani]NJW52125.1 metallophosphatase [Salinimicrobium oceani]